MAVNTDWEPAKFRPDALRMLRELSYKLTGELNRKVSLTDALRIACRSVDMDMLLDPDCKAGKHASCAGERCFCSYHVDGTGD